MAFQDNLPYILFGVFGLGLLSLYLYIGFGSSQTDNASEINKQIGIVAGVTTVLVLLFGVITYVYFSVNVNYITPYLLVSNNINLLLSIIAVAISSLRLSN
jgi:hypothetical protein